MRGPMARRARPTSTPPAPTRLARAAQNGSAAPTPITAETITVGQLESHLWESANILRGPVDAADFKTYIFPLLFFKRICEAWDEEYEEIVADTGDAELALFPESHRF